MHEAITLAWNHSGRSWRPDSWPFEQPFHLIFNIVVGGVWGRAGGPIDDSIFPQRMLIDYARVYQLQK